MLERAPLEATERQLLHRRADGLLRGKIIALRGIPTKPTPAHYASGDSGRGLCGRGPQPPVTLDTAASRTHTRMARPSAVPAAPDSSSWEGAAVVVVEICSPLARSRCTRPRNLGRCARSPSAAEW
mmetsp:Transcript_56638/g.159749  ORF Transcript_56638/g.159749 Transcript_56638/m.159749 type:complete len:126 (-) Transcript_56638:1351-1728(-)